MLVLRDLFLTVLFTVCTIFMAKTLFAQENSMSNSMVNSLEMVETLNR